MTTSAHSDAELLARARQGDETAFAELYVRHEAAALRLARGYPRAGDPDDLVSESFTRVLRALRHGAGPTRAFRAYLFVALRRIAAARIARRQDDPYDEVPEPVRTEAVGAGAGSGSLFGSDAEADDRRIVIDAYESLPSRWQSVLWHTAVEGHRPRELGPTLGMSANAAAALAYRAREKLRQAYLQAHLRVTSRPQCEPHRSRLGAYVRDGLGPRDRALTSDHLGSCSSCRGLVGELTDINRLLVRSMVPFFVTTGSISGAVTAVKVTTAAAGAETVAQWRAGHRARASRQRSPGLVEHPGVAAGAVVAAAVLVTVMVAVLADHTLPPAPLNLPPVPSSRPDDSESALPVRPDRDGTSGDEPVVVDGAGPEHDPAASARPPSPTVTGSSDPSDAASSPGSPAVASSPSPSPSPAPPANRSPSSVTVPPRPSVTTPPPVAVPGPRSHPLPTTPTVTQPPVTTPPLSPPTTRPPVPQPPVTVTVPTTMPVPTPTRAPVPVPVPSVDPGGGLFGCGCDILSSLFRGLF